MSRGEGCRSNCEISINLEVCRRTFKAGLKRRGSKSCRTLSKNETTSYQSTRGRGRDLKRYRASRIGKEICSRKLLLLRKRCGRLHWKSRKERSAFCSCPFSHRATGGQQNWKNNFGACRQERKEGAATPPKSLNTMGAVQARQRLQVPQEKFLRRFEAPTPPAQMPGREEG